MPNLHGYISQPRGAAAVLRAALLVLQHDPFCTHHHLQLFHLWRHHWHRLTDVLDFFSADRAAQLHTAAAKLTSALDAAMLRCHHDSFVPSAFTLSECNLRPRRFCTSPSLLNSFSVFLSAASLPHMLPRAALLTPWLLRSRPPGRPECGDVHVCTYTYRKFPTAVTVSLPCTGKKVAEFPSDQLLPAACMLLADRLICYSCSSARELSSALQL